MTLSDRYTFYLVILQTTGLKDESFSECASAGYAIKPVKGSAVFFFNLNLDSTPDNSSLHQSCKVLEGAKWSTTKYFHTGPTDRRQLTSSLTLTVNQEECSDEDDNCASWAEFGECERNPIFMLGSADYSGACRKSCNACWFLSNLWKMCHNVSTYFLIKGLKFFIVFCRHNLYIFIPTFLY